MQIYACSIGLFPYRVAGDKNFYHDCFRALRLPPNTNVHILSFTGRSGEHATLTDRVRLTELARPLHRNEYQRYGGVHGTLPYFRHAHPMPRELIERTTCLLAALRTIRRLAGPRPHIVHFLDNFGPFMSAAASAAGARQSVISARPLYWPHTPLSQMYVRASTGTVDHIGASSYVCMDILTAAGISTRRLHRQRWGVTMPSDIPSPHHRSTTYLWSGFLPHSGLAGFKTALHAARAIERASDLDVDFHFAIRPTSWRPDFLQYGSPKIYIESSHRPFKQLLANARALVSPLQPGAPLVPPLSWLEAMSQGVPIITNQVRGIDELITDGCNGFIQRTDESFSETIRRANDSDMSTIGANARDTIRENFTLDHAVQDISQIWEAAH